MLTLACGASSIVVVPERGAGLIGWMSGATPLLRRGLPEAACSGNPHAMGCFPLLPYCNRIGGGRFVWDGREYRLRANFGDSPHSIHGVGWQRAWTVEAVSRDSVLLSLDHQPDRDWPFAFSARLGYWLSADGLSVEMQITNRHDRPAPAGLGLHPYFPRASNPALRFNAAGAWRNGGDMLPAAHGPVPEDWLHERARPVAESHLDNCFTGWDGVAQFGAAHSAMRIEASGVFGNLQVFTPPWADFFCVEPATHVPDAINRAEMPEGQGMIRLPPGAALSGTIRLRAQAG